MKRPVSSAADAVIILKVEPGWYLPAVARFRSGAPHGAVVRVACAKWRSIRFGL